MPVLTKSIDCIISIRQLSVPYNLAIHMMLIIPSFYQKPIIFRILRAALAARDRKIYIIIFSFFDVNSIKYISQRIQKVNIYKYLHLHFIDIIFL